MSGRLAGTALAGLALALAAAGPAAAFPGLAVVDADEEAAAAIYDGRPGLTGLTEAFRQGPIGSDPRWSPAWQAGAVAGRELAGLGVAQMAAALRAAWKDPAVGDLVSVDELVAADWTVARARALQRALESLGPDARRVVVYVGPGLVGEVARADPRYGLSRRLDALLAALRRAGAVQLRAWAGGGPPPSRARLAAAATRWLDRFAPGDPGKLHLVFGPVRGSVTQDELWSRARSTPAGRALLANGASASGLGGAEEGLGWLDGYRDFLSEPSAIPPAGDVAVPTGGGLGLAAAGERTVTVRLSRPARAVVSLRPVGSARSRVIARLRGPLYPRSITLPVDVAPGRYRVRATARGDGLTDSVDIPFRVRAPRVQSVADPRVQQAGGAPSAARTTRPARRADLLRSLIILDARYRVLLRQAAACARRPLRAEIALRRRAVAGATLASPATLGRRLSLLAAGARRLERVSRPCGPPLVPPASPPPAAPPSAPPSPPVAGAPSLTPITIGHIVAGTPLDLSAPLGERVLPSQVIPVELAALNGPACRAAGAVCLGFDRTLLELALNELVNQNLLDLTVRNLLSLNLDGLIAQVASLGAGGDLGESIAVERIDDRSLRLVPLGPLAALVDLPKISDTVVGQVQAVPEIATGVAAVPPGTPQPGPYRPGAAPGERALLRAINRARAQRRLPGLKASRVLARPARLHSANLVRLGYLTHDSNGSPFWTRLVASGFSARRHMGENLAQISGCSPSGAEQAVKVWLGSPVHRANLFSRKFRVLGAGATSDGGCARTVYNADFGG